MTSLSTQDSDGGGVEAPPQVPATLAPPGTRRIPSLDGLRAISIVFVLLSHTAGTVPAHRPNFLLDRAVLFFGDGDLGVAVFFVISGYLITRLLLKEHEKTGRIHLRDFYLRRAFRILPAAYSYIAFIAIVTWVAHLRLNVRDFIAAATFTWNYRMTHTGQDYWFLGHLWSLSVEEQFYLLWPLTLLLLAPRRSTIAAAIVVIASPAIRVATYFLFPVVRGHIQMMLHTRADTLMFGCFAALVSDTDWFERLVKQCASIGLHWAAAAYLIFIGPLIEVRLRWAYMFAVGYTLQAASITLLLVWAVRNPQRGVARALNWAWVGQIGVLSYSIYLWQQPFLTPSNHTFTGRYPMNVLVALTAAVLSYFLVEQPFLSLRQAFRPR